MDGSIGPSALADVPTAVIFGNEHAGVSAEAESLADGSYAIPMAGFVESLNVSVAAAVTLYAATAGRTGDLHAEEQRTLKARFLLASVRDAERVVEERVRAR